jgi:conjugative relaxase-like TrwC/TraI family protein
MLSTHGLRNLRLPDGRDGAAGTRNYYEPITRADWRSMRLEAPDETQSMGMWRTFGAHAPRGLDGSRLAPEDLERALRGEWLGGAVQNAHKPDRQIGWDMVLSPPKAVSTLYATADAETRAWIDRELRDTAALVIRRFVAPEVTTRLGHGGHEREAVSFAANTYLQHLSRADDPQLHMHHVIPNFGWSRDGQVRTIESRWLFDCQLAAGVAFDAELLERFRRRGYRFSRDAEGDLRAEGIDSKLEELYSKRSEAITAALEDKFGLEYTDATPGQRKEAQRLSRDAHNLEYVEDWRDQAVAAGLADAWARAEREHQAARERARQAEHARVNPERLAMRLDQAADRAAHDLVYGTERSRATNQEQLGSAGVTRHRLLAEVAGHAREVGGGVDDVLAAVKRAEERGGIVTLERAEHGAGLRDMWSAPDFIEREHNMRDRFAELCAHTGYRVDVPDRLLRDLSDEQRDAVRSVCSERGIAMIEGLAGVGKTSVLARAREALEADGYRVVGEAHLGAPVEELRSRGGIAHSRTIALAETHGRDLDRRTVVIVDEFQSSSSLQMARLIDDIHASGAKLVLVGDPGRARDDERSRDDADAGQHGPVGPGAPARHLAAVARELAPQGCNVMRDIQRQRPLELRRIAELATTGRGAEALRETDEHGWLRVTSTSDEMRREVSVYIADSLRAGSALCVTGSRAEEAAVNAAVRDERKARGDLGEDVPYRLGKGKQQRELALAAGDRIAWRRNDYELGVRTGQRAAVVAVNPRTAEALVRQETAARQDRDHQPILEHRTVFHDDRTEHPITDPTREFILTREQIESLARGKPLWSHDYARTSKRAESATVDRQAVAVHAESKSVSRQFASAGWTRSREELRVWISAQGIEPEREVTREGAHWPRGTDPDRAVGRRVAEHKRERQDLSKRHELERRELSARHRADKGELATRHAAERRGVHGQPQASRRATAEAHQAARQELVRRHKRERHALAERYNTKKRELAHRHLAAADGRLDPAVRDEALRAAAKRLERDAPGETTLAYPTAREQARVARERQDAHERREPRDRAEVTVGPERQREARQS